MKRHILITLMLLISQILTAQTTLKDQLTAVHEAFGVNFVYDSSLDLEQIAGHAGNDVLKETDNDVIEKIVKDGKTYFVINDYEKLRGLFAELLKEIQRIKSEGDYEAGKQLIETYAVKVDPVLHKEVKERYDALNLRPYGGFINPDIVPVEKGGKVVDYVINYPSDFVQQHLDYGKKYAFLKENHAAPTHLVVDMLYDFIDGSLACGNAEEAVKEVVFRNGNLRAEFFRDVWQVESVRKTFDKNEIGLFRRVLNEGIDKGVFDVKNVRLTAEITHYCLKGCEVPYIYGRYAVKTSEELYPYVKRIVQRLKIWV